jgi:two-component system sensor histidine kinase/response regulator
VMDGYEATRKICEWQLKAQGSKLKGNESEEPSASSFQLSARAKRVPIIAMTAHAMAGDEQKSLAAGMNDHVTKPIDPDQLFAALLKWIKPAEGRTVVPKSLPASGGPQAIDANPEPDQAVQDENELPESMPGFNLAAGLKRLMGNKTLYRKLLLDFGETYGGVANEIREALAGGDFEQAHSLVHNLKGLAGNLEATDLQAAAVGMEKIVKGQTGKTISDKKLNQKSAELEKAINQALEAVQSLGLPAEEKIVEPSAEWLAEIPVGQAKEATDRINVAAEMGDVMQIKLIAEELMAESEAVAPFYDKLIRLAEDFDFDGIQKFMLEVDS